MKAQLLFLFALCTLNALSAQVPLSRNEALKQLYKQYDNKTETAQWVCTKDQEQGKNKPPWPCWKENSTVSISVLMTAEMKEGEGEKLYLVASAKPAKAPLGFDCHACQPVIGVAVFASQDQHWVLESANAAIGTYGGWGGPPSVDLIEVGPGRHGIILSDTDSGQGFTSSFKTLLMPVGKTVSQVWRICDERDDAGAYDPSDKWSIQVLYRSSVGIRLFAGGADGSDPGAYYDIEAISRGTDLANGTQRLKPENWTEIYRFDGHQYKLLKRTVYREMKGLQK
ncbi:MAG: hypothetical protein WBM14_12445, partial [Terracidiphilus sp.]